MKFGFLGLGIMGSGIVKNLLNSGHKVVVWNRTAAKVSDVTDVTWTSFNCLSQVYTSTNCIGGVTCPIPKYGLSFVWPWNAHGEGRIFRHFLVQCLYEKWICIVAFCRIFKTEIRFLVEISVVSLSDGSFVLLFNLRFLYVVSWSTTSIA